MGRPRVMIKGTPDRHDVRNKKLRHFRKKNYYYREELHGTHCDKDRKNWFLLDTNIIG